MIQYNPFDLPVRNAAGLDVVDMPITIGDDKTCSRCAELLLDGSAYVVDLPSHLAALCRTCTAERPSLWPWQALADAYNAIDTAFQTTRTRDQRQVFVDLLTSHVTYMANWRWEDDAPIEARPLAPEFEDAQMADIDD